MVMLLAVFGAVVIDRLYPCLQELGYPWVMRKSIMKYGAKSTDIVRHKGSLMTVTTVNAKGSWTRTLDTERALQQVSSKRYHNPMLRLLSPLGHTAHEHRMQTSLLAGPNDSNNGAHETECEGT